ncbi:MAG: Tfp pilus assembly protein FimT/FimU [bacterium]
MNGRFSSESGVTIIELMLVVAIIGIITAVGTYNFLAELPAYRLRGAVNKVAASVQLVKMRAIAKNRNAWIVVNPSNNFFTGFVDEDADSAIDAPGEYTEMGMDMPDTFGGVPGFLLPEDVSFGWPSSYGGTGPDGVSPGGDTDGVFVAGTGMSGKNNIGFRPTGLPVVDLAAIQNPTESVIIFLKNTREQGFAISIGITGRVKTYKWSGGSWQ